MAIKKGAQRDRERGAGDARGRGERRGSCQLPRMMTTMRSEWGNVVMRYSLFDPLNEEEEYAKCRNQGEE